MNTEPPEQSTLQVSEKSREHAMSINESESNKTESFAESDGKPEIRETNKLGNSQGPDRSTLEKKDGNKSTIIMMMEPVERESDKRPQSSQI